jgi:hypothetical protein
MPPVAGRDSGIVGEALREERLSREIDSLDH